MTRREALILAPAAALAQVKKPFDVTPKRNTGAGTELLECNRIWGQAPHNAFTDLVRFKERWYCVFREGATHVSEDGVIRVLSSADAVRWESAAKIDYPSVDLRDPKVSIGPGNRLVIVAAARMHPSAGYKHKTLLWTSNEGRMWSSPEEIGDRDHWLWRITWHRDRAYGFGYGTAERRLRLYMSPDGVRFDTLHPAVLEADYPNETSMLFLNDESALCLLRRDEGSKTALLGHARPPYRAWKWTDLGRRIGGPHMIRLPDGRLLAAVRLHEGKTRTALVWVEPQAPGLTEFLPLPSSGDSSYAGLVYHDGLLYVSYYSSHEGKSAIYLAKVRLASA